MRIEPYIATATRLGIVCLSLAVPQTIAQTPSPASPIQDHLRAGPVYTGDGSSTGNGSPPKFPDFDVVVPLDPASNLAAENASDWQAVEPGASVPLQAVNVRPFERTGYGVAVTLALDVSGSMHGKALDRIRGSIAKFVNDAQPQDRVAVMTFANESRWDVPFSANPNDVRAALAALTTRGNETHLYDAMLDAIDRFDDSMPRRRVLIVISDGHDEGSEHTLDEVIAEAGSHKIAINAIGVTRSDPRYLAFLQKIAQSTGGSYAPAQSDEELDRLIANGIAALKQTPVVTFRSALDTSTAQTVLLTITWKPKNITATADLTTLPTAGTQTDKKKRAALVGSAILLLLVIFAIFFVVRARRRPRPFAESLPEEPVQASIFKSAPAQTTEFAVISADVPTLGEARPPDQQRSQHAQAIPDLEASAFIVPPDAPVANRRTRVVHLFRLDPVEPFAVLDVTAGPLAGTGVPIYNSPFTIGATDGNSLQISDDPAISGNHACLSLERSVLMLDDLGSTNGTYINGVRIFGERRSLAVGDELRMGGSIFRVLRKVPS